MEQHLKALQDKVANLKQTLCDSFEMTMWDVLRFQEQVMDQVSRFWPDAISFIEAFDPFKSAPDITQKGGPGASDSDGYTSFFFPRTAFYFLQFS